MAFCSKCGAQISGGVKFCPTCGNPVSTSGSSDLSSTFDPADIQENKVLSVLCYFSLFILIPLVAKPDSAYIKFHINQGLILILAGIISSLMFIVPILGWIAGALSYIFLLVCCIIGVVNAFLGKAKQLPLIGNYVILKW